MLDSDNEPEPAGGRPEPPAQFEQPDSSAQPELSAQPESSAPPKLSAPPESSAPPGPGGGLCWSYELDLDEVMSAIGASRDEDPADQEASLAAERELVESAEGKPRDLTGAVAEHLPAGPGLAAWLANAEPGDLSDWDLPTIAAAYRRVASWAQAAELAAVAAIASRSAARDEKIGVDDEGRPGRVAPGAAAEVSLALRMSQCGASWWTHLGVDLGWRLRATGGALAAGTIDLSRARLIAEATNALDDDTARAVEGIVLPTAGDKTTAQLRAALRRAVISADPNGAEERRQEAERRAKVALYPDDNGTSTLVSSGLPSVHGAAAMARISAMAWALKASGAGGGIDLLRAQVLIGLILGTLPLIPPDPDRPPDQPPADDDPGGDGPSGGDPGDGDPGDGFGGPDDGRGTGGPADEGSRPRKRHGRPAPTGPPGPNVATEDLDEAADPDKAADPPEPADPPEGADLDGRTDPNGAFSELRDLRNASGPAVDPGEGEAWQPEAGYLDETDEGRLEPAWPPLPATIAQVPPVLGRPPGRSGAAHLGSPAPGPRGGRETRRPPPGLLDLSMSWSSLTGLATAPAWLGRIGPITVQQALPLAGIAALDPYAQWRVILTGPDSHAIAVERVRRGPRARRRGRMDRDASADGNVRAASDVRADRDSAGDCGRAHGVVGRVTVVVPADLLRQAGGLDADHGIRTAILRAARRAAARAAAIQAKDADAAGGCAHTIASASYRPPSRIREFVEARDQTCRQPTCRQPAWQTDLDHTIAWDSGGLTCSCNLGGLCRTHHQVKQQPGWQLIQPAPGVFRWTTPAGHSCISIPDSYSA